jgi:hypothetical protein
LIGCGATDSGVSSISQTEPSKGSGSTSPSNPEHFIPTQPNEIILSGNCPTGAISVTISNPINQTVTCQNGKFTVTINLTAIPDGKYQLGLQFNNGPTGGQELIVDNKTPMLSITNIPNGITAIVTNNNVNAFIVEGTCKSSLNTVTVQVASISQSVNCTSEGTYSASLNLSSLANGSSTGSVSQTETNENKISKLFEIFKDTSSPILLANQSNFSNVRRILLSANREGQISKKTQGGAYAVTGVIGMSVNSATPRNGGFGYKIEGSLRRY